MADYEDVTEERKPLKIETLGVLVSLYCACIIGRVGRVEFSIEVPSTTAQFVD